MFSNGTYRVHSVTQTQGKPLERMIGRFSIKNKEFSLLEDHDELLADSIHDGPLDERHAKILWNLMHSGYFKVIPEEELNVGHHEDLIEDLDIGPVHSDEYLLSSIDSAPKRVETYGDNFVIDGKKLSEEELKDLMDKIHSGQYRLIPI